MQPLKWIPLFITGIILCGCPEEFPDNQHSLWLSFQDVSGNDLVKGINMSWAAGVPGEDPTSGKISSESFEMLDITFSDLYDEQAGTTDVIKWNNYYYIRLELFSRANNESNSSPKISFKLRCPYIFDDADSYSKYYQFVTYWKRSTKRDDLHLCYLIEFEGKEITDITYENPYNNPAVRVSLATIILDK